MRKVDDGEKKRRRKEKKRMTFLVATTSLPAVYRPNGYARTTTAGMPHARANMSSEYPLNVHALYGSIRDQNGAKMLAISESILDAHFQFRFHEGSTFFLLFT